MTLYYYRHHFARRRHKTKKAKSVAPGQDKIRRHRRAHATDNAALSQAADLSMARRDGVPMTTRTGRTAVRSQASRMNGTFQENTGHTKNTKFRITAEHFTLRKIDLRRVACRMNLPNEEARQSATLSTGPQENMHGTAIQ